MRFHAAAREKRVGKWNPPTRRGAARGSSNEARYLEKSFLSEMNSYSCTGSGRTGVMAMLLSNTRSFISRSGEIVPLIIVTVRVRAGQLFDCRGPVVLYPGVSRVKPATDRTIYQVRNDTSNYSALNDSYTRP